MFFKELKSLHPFKEMTAMKALGLLLSAACILTFAGCASAQEKPPVETPLKKWLDAENALIKPLGEKDQESFFILRNKYSIIRVIGIVERDVGNAVQSCGKANPDIKKQMDERFAQWKAAVNPIVDTAKKQLEKDLDGQKYVDPKKARDVFKLNDEAYEYGEKQIVKQPVTTKEACGDLLSSMDRTEDEMVTLLQNTLLPESVIRTRSKKAEAEQPVKAEAKDPAKKSE
jgi:hypothetical protein